MERVQFEQEQMLAELKDFVQRGIFTPKETKEIMKRRTAFETALVRRIPRKTDYVRYAAYEMGLEQLRKKRIQRLDIPPSPGSVSEYGLVRRQFQIFERALKKFKEDVSLWVEYAELAKQQGARALVGRITARALQLHPNVPELYVLAAAHELEQQSPTAARALLQRGLRLNGDSVEMWRAYVEMELGFAESMRRRWDVLGIDVESRADGDEKAILEGRIVMTVITAAAKAVPKLELFRSVRAVVVSYPMPGHVRKGMLAHLYEEWRASLPNDPEGVRLHATRNLQLAQGEPLIEGLRQANEVFVSAIRAANGGSDVCVGRCPGPLLQEYRGFIEEWCREGIDNVLQEYLIGSLSGVIRRHRPSCAEGVVRASDR